MSKEEFLRRLEEALSGEVPASVIRENLNYYNTYITQEMAKGRTMEEITAEIGDARIVARTIIDSCEAAGEATGSEVRMERGGENPYEERRERDPFSHIHYIDLNKWYWNLLLLVLFFLVLSVVMGIVGGIFSLLMRFAGPILVIALIYWFIKGMRQ